MLRRVTLIIVLAVAAILSHTACAQQPSVQRIGFLGLTPAPSETRSSLIEVLRKALANLGYAEDRNIIIESRWPEGNQLDRLPETAAALVSLKLDVIVAVGATAARAAQGATTDIPIVFAVSVDPVAFGWRPGGNVTGFTSLDQQQARKQLEILKELIPGLARVALLGDAGAAPTLFHENEDAARTLGLQTQTLKVVRVPNPDFEGAFEAAKKEGAGAVVVINSPVTTPNRTRIAELAAKHRLPTLSPSDHADAGGLISYGTGFPELIQRAATSVDKVLRGAKPGDLPVETVTQHQFIINLKTAREIGVTFPPAMLSNASQVIR